MKKEGEIRWIQLSDLHMFDSTEVSRQKTALFDQFGETIDFVVITGDLHQYDTNYNLTKSFLEELVVQMHIEKKDIFTVPGNHDAGSCKNRKEIIEGIDKSIGNDADAYRKDLKQLLPAFNKYKKFLTDFYGNNIQKFAPLNNNVYVWDDKIAILCLNTALISDENHYKPQIIDIYGLEKLENTYVPCIAIMHHDYYAITDIHKPFLQTKFKELGVSAVLSGHKHKYTTNVIELGNGETIPDFCCAKSVSEPGDLWSDVGLIEYRWKTDRNKINVIPYEWNPLHMNFIPSTKLESREKIKVDENGKISLKKNFVIRNIENKITNNLPDKNQSGKNNKLMENTSEFKDFYETVQKQYLDGILNYIGEDKEKFECAKAIMEKFIWYKNKRADFEEISNLVISCEQKMVLAINGLQGTGKSTFLSLLYYKMIKNFEDTKVFPVLIDLHCLEKFSKSKAKGIINNHLDKIDSLIEQYPETKFLLMFDGVDEYLRKTSELEDILVKYVSSHKEGNFAFCIGSAEKLPDEMIIDAKLQSVSRKATYKVEARGIEKSDDENITFIIRNLCRIYGFSIEESAIQSIKKVINVYTINKIDYRTLLIVLRVFNYISINNNELQLGNYFYEYYKMEMSGDKNELIKHAKATYQYTVLKEKKALEKLKHAKIIYNNGITRDFLLAYYFVYLINDDWTEIGGELNDVLNSNFVFTASANKFIKDLLLSKYKKNQSNIVKKLIKAYNCSNMSMKSQIGYILGRIKESNAVIEARSFLDKRWNELYNALFEDNILISQKQDIKSELVLFRTISVSLIWLGHYNNQDKFLRCIILNEKLNQINRGFHLEYYEDKAYINGESPTYVDDATISVDKTMNYLINNINKGFSAKGDFNKSIYLDIITLYSIYQYRMDNEEIKKKYEQKLLGIADNILKSPKIQSETIINYVTTIKELLAKNPYKMFLKELYRVKDIKREGWVRRKIITPESIADHMYCCYILGLFFLPNNIKNCIDYNIPDINEYESYSKDRILQMLLLHDLAEAKIGDIVAPEKNINDNAKERKRFDYYEFLCSFPKVYGLGNRKAIWDEFAEKSTINAKIANDIDKIESVIQADIYWKRGNKINMDEWIDYAHQNVGTSLGKKLLDFALDKIIKD